ncbi:cytochrome P450 [Streptomyces sp. NPDC059009]|uniref:cytochrome P450 n=1 Tax=Streptomyces sp. NPDC059009 TaxID=3346694 RepID=UPI0036CC5CF6
MPNSLPAVAELPMTRPEGRPWDPPEEFARLRAEQPLCRLTFPDGHVGWLATSHALVREVLADPRFSSRQELMHSPLPGANALERMPPADPGMFIRADGIEHSRYRTMLTGKFTVRRMRQLTDRIEQFASELLDAMERQGSSADLVTAFARPLPALVICDLLGVPYADREFFQERTATINDADATPEVMEQALNEAGAFLYELVKAKRADPTDDLLSDLTKEDLTEPELIQIALLLLGGGLDTTTNMIGLGTFALLSHPEQLAALRAEPELIDGAVEELMRFLTIAPVSARSALEDIELGGRQVKAGETVAVAMHAANRDPEKYPDPDTLDVRRRAVGQLGFGHGVHQCLGQQLGRIEMQVGFRGLIRRFPHLRLAVPADQVRTREDSFIGVYGLPVAWDEV